MCSRAVRAGWGLFLIGRKLEAAAGNRGALWLASYAGLPSAEFRARNNLGSFMLWSDPAEMLSLMIDGMDRALRQGDVETHASLGAKAVYAADSLGEWDVVEEILDGIVRTGISSFARQQLDLFEAAHLSRKGDFDRAAELLRESEVATRETDSPQAKGVFHMQAGLAAWARRDLAGFLENTIEAERYLPGFDEHRLGVAAVAARDRELLRSTISSIGGRAVLDDRTGTWLEAMKACAEIMDGDTSAASRVLEHVQRMKKHRFVVDAGDWLTALTMLLPDGTPDASEAEAEAREIWSTLGARGMLDVLGGGSPD